MRPSRSGSPPGHSLVIIMVLASVCGCRLVYWLVFSRKASQIDRRKQGIGASRSSKEQQSIYEGIRPSVLLRPTVEDYFHGNAVEDDFHGNAVEDDFDGDDFHGITVEDDVHGIYDSVHNTNAPKVPLSIASEDECRAMQKRHDVVVGISWGDLPPEKQLRWQSLRCDDMGPEVEDVEVLVEDGLLLSAEDDVVDGRQTTGGHVMKCTATSTFSSALAGVVCLLGCRSDGNALAVMTSSTLPCESKSNCFSTVTCCNCKRHSIAAARMSGSLLAPNLLLVVRPRQSWLWQLPRLLDK